MLEYIEVDGFKSLRNFSLELKPGLNVLVGPNGSGKTNIISFVEFLGLLLSDTAPKAISAAGGAGSVFSKIGENSYSSKIKSNLKGNIQVGNKKWIYYEYSFVIALSKGLDTIIYESQRIKIKKRTVRTPLTTELQTFDVDIERTTDSNLESSTIVHNLSPKKIDNHIGLFRATKNINDKQIESEIKRIIDDSIEHRESILPILRYLLEGGYRIFADLKGGLVYNIEPSRCRMPEDAAKPPGIHKDGSGLYSTLFALTQVEQLPRIRRGYNVFYNEELSLLKKVKIEKITDYIKLANPSIEKIDVRNNPFDNQLQVRIHIKNVENHYSILPLTAMSDGTVKWICLVTILLTSRNVLSIEEPENYLHPLMQKEIVTIMRDVIGKNTAVLLSTHSETFLNSALPEEIIIVQFKEGATHACRPQNISSIMEEINATGFGLGYYYLSGALIDE
jgi:predicted ATPase